MLRNLFFDDRPNGRPFHLNNNGLNITSGAFVFLTCSNIFFSILAANAGEKGASVLFDRAVKYLLVALFLQTYKYGTDTLVNMIPNRNFNR